MYDYHPKMGVNVDLETNSLISRAELNGDCLICMGQLNETPEVELNRFDAMVAPCNHVFHTNCLLNWMKIKMQCPVCRTQLPQV